MSLAFVHASASAVWPPTGIALAAFILFGHRVWPAVLAAAFLANITTAGNVATSAGIATGNTLEGVLGAYLIRRFAGGKDVFEQPTRIFRYALLAGLLSTMVSATVGVTSLSLGGFAPWSRYGAIWFTWWLGDAAGALVLAPFLILWGTDARVSWRASQSAELGALLATVAVLSLFVFCGMNPFANKHYPTQFLCFPPLVWAAFRFGQREAATSIALLSAIALAGTIRGLGPFAARSPNESLLLLQSFMAVISILHLVLAAAISDRRRVETSVRLLNDELERRVAERTEQLWVANQELKTQVRKRARAQENLERSDARLREAQRAARMGSWEWDIERDTVWWSDELYGIYGLNPGEVGASYEGFLDRIHPEDRVHAHATVSAALHDKKPFTFEHRIIRPDGSIRNLLGQGGVIADKRGRPIRMVGTAQDITEYKTAEAEREALRREQAARREAEEANRLKDEFLATLSHELRTPLNAIAGWANLLREGKLDQATTARAVETITRNVRAQSHLISDILDISRMEMGQVELRKQPVDLANVIESAVDTMRPTAAAKRVYLESKLATNGRCVDGDPDRLQQVVWNLLSNGIQFAPEGGRVTIELETDGSTARIRVEDDGPGIDAEFLPHVFERYRQRDSAGSRAHGGLGLGLAIVRHLVELHGGAVRAANRDPGPGALLEVSLPLIPATLEKADGVRPPEAVRATGGVTAPDALKGTRILLVEDNRDSRELVAMHLSRLGGHVVAVGTCREAVVAFEAEEPDVLISDIAMPDGSGYDLIERLRSIRGGGGSPVPAIALTAYAGTDDVRRAMRAGFQAHLAKPVELVELVRTAKELVERR